MANEKRLIDANAFKVFLEDVRQCYLEEDTFSSNFAAELIETVQDNYLELAPTVDAVEVVHGRWLDVKETELYVPDKKYTVTHTAETCSNCKVRIGFIGGKQYLYDNQCPNCGAKMDLE